MTAHLRFTLAAVLLSLTTLARAEIAVIEYYHSAFDHYFVTGAPDEIAKLDNGTFAGWTRTGRKFNAYAPGSAGTAATCRFFSTSFGERSSHFYTADASECATVKSNPNWQFEAEVFDVALPAADGTCGPSTVPVYRVYNNGQGGAPNHRFVTSLADRQAMLDRGFLAEGAGIGVAMCAPSGITRHTAEGFWTGITSEGQPVRIIVLENGHYYIVYTDGGQIQAGVLAGSFDYTGGGLASDDAAYVQLTGPLKGFAGTVLGTFSSGNALRLNFGTSTVTATYDATYDAPATLRDLVGRYIGNSGHNGEFRSASATIDAQGSILIEGLQCSFVGMVAGRSVNLFDATVQGGGNCAALPKDLHAIVLLDASRGTLSFLTDVYVNPYYGVKDLSTMFGGR